MKRKAKKREPAPLPVFESPRDMSEAYPHLYPHITEVTPLSALQDVGVLPRPRKERAITAKDILRPPKRSKGRRGG